MTTKFRIGQPVRIADHNYWATEDGRYVGEYQLGKGRYYNEHREERCRNCFNYNCGCGPFEAKIESKRHIPTEFHDDDLLQKICGPMAMGSDPEFFLGQGGVPLPAFGFLPDKKEAIEPGQPFWDGFQGEVKTAPFRCHVRYLWDGMRPAIRAFKRLHNLEIIPKPVWRIPDSLLQTALEEHVRLGCDPSLNAYGMKGRPVDNGRLLPVRFSGGHIHFELPEDYKNDREMNLRAIRSLDAFCGVPAVCLFQNYDHPIRRRYYGLAGEFRKPPHGLEWRTLSNGWCLHPLSAQLILDMARWAFQLGFAGWSGYLHADPKSVVDIINNHDVREAKAFMAKYEPLFMKWATERYSKAGMFWRAIDKGIEAAVPDFGKDVDKSWEMEEWSGLTEWRMTSSEFHTWKGLEATCGHQAD